MWGGIDFFVGLETLVSFTIPDDFTPSSPSASPEAARNTPHHLPGNPTVRRLELSKERRLTPLFVYPNASLFLQVLSSTGNKVHLITPWSKEDTTAILKALEWVGLLVDARRVSVIPGTTEYSFASLGVDPTLYTRAVLVVGEAARWCSVTALQLIEVQHTREGVHAADSMELLYALSRCLLFSEWLLRYPSSAISSCAALSNTALFAYCRFCFTGEVADAELMMLVSFHGGRLVTSEAEATHVVVLPPPEPVPSSSASSSTESSSDEESSGHSAVDSSSSEGDSESEEEKPEEEKGKQDTLAGGVADRGGRGQGQAGGSAPPAGRVEASSATPAASSFVTAATATVSTPSAINAVAPAQAAPSAADFVTPRWVYRCIRALRLLPLEEEEDTEDGDGVARGESAALAPDTPVEQQQRQQQEEENESDKEEAAARRRAACVSAYKSHLLLSCLLPPADARPFLWTTFQSIARQHHYDLTCFAPCSALSSSATPFHPPTAYAVMESLTSPIFAGVVEVRLLPPPTAARAGNATGSGGSAASAAARLRGVVVTRATLHTVRVSSASAELSRVAVGRCERRRDKEAVFAHLQLVASQFLYSYDVVRRQRARLLHREAGTQTGGTRHASIGVMTEVEGVAVAAKEESKATSAATAAAAEPAQSSSPPPPQVAGDAIGSVDAEEWRHHLKNVEGKLLVSHHNHPSAQQQETNKEEEGRGSSGDARGTGSEAVHGASSRDDAATAVASVASTENASPAPATAGGSIFPASDLIPSLLDDALVSSPYWRHASSPHGRSEYTACFIPTAALTEVQQCDFLIELRLYPIFASPELGNRVVRLPGGVKIEFTSHKDAEDFCRIEFIEFLSLHLPIYPYLESATSPIGNAASGAASAQASSPSYLMEGVPLPQQAESLLLPSVAPEQRVAGRSAGSLWAAPEMSDVAPRPITATASAFSKGEEVGAANHSNEAGGDAHRRWEGVTQVPPYRAAGPHPLSSYPSASRPYGKAPRGVEAPEASRHGPEKRPRSDVYPSQLPSRSRAPQQGGGARDGVPRRSYDEDDRRRHSSQHYREESRRGGRHREAEESRRGGRHREAEESRHGQSRHDVDERGSRYGHTSSRRSSYRRRSDSL